MERTGAVLAAEDLGARTRRGWIFSGVSLRAAPGSLVAVAGPGGSGRSSLLLTLGGRMRHSTGTLEICGLPLPAQRTKAREHVAIGRVSGGAELEPDLRVRDHIKERRTMASHAMAFEEASGMVGLSVPGSTLVKDLSSAESALLALALALMERREIALLDDLDEGVPDQRLLWLAARQATSYGMTVLASTVDATPANGIADGVIALGGADAHA